MILLNRQRYENRTLSFDGREHRIFAALAERLGAIVNEPIPYISPDAAIFENQMNRVCLPHPVIDILKTFRMAIAQGEFDQRVG